MPEIRQTRPDELHDALALIFALPGVTTVRTQAQASALLAYARDRPTPPDCQCVVDPNGDIRAAGICLDSPGRAALLFLQSLMVLPQRGEDISALLERMIRSAARRGVGLLQVLLPPGATQDEALLGSAGFEFLAELIYLERPSTLPLDRQRDPDGIDWTCYSAEAHALFARVIEATYENSRDCPGLFGRREIEDIIAGHKDAGVFDPAHWFVLRQYEEPVGCLLLSRVKNRSALELVYMGLRPEARGRGLAKTMLRRTVQLASKERLGYVTLAVDADNTPARSLYERFRFVETMRRLAWILSLSTTL